MRRHLFSASAALVAITVTAGAAVAKDGSAAKTVVASTLTGCLHEDGDHYVVRDVAGAHKGRTWKTAFVTRSSKDVEIVSAPATLKLKDHVGHKVTLSGTRGDAGHFTPRAIKQFWQVSSCS